NTDVISDFSPTGGFTTNSLRFNTPGAITLTLLAGNNALQSGGILVTPNVGAFTTTITGPNLFGNPSIEIVIHQFNLAGSLDIRASVFSSSHLTISGGGAV